ncbi:MAG: hypothetical protein ACPLRW_05995 [Moorellales bacterium]
MEERLPDLLYALVLQDFPESLVMTLVVLSLLNYRLLRPRTIIIALLQTVTNLVRLLPVVFGMHTVVLLISLTVYTSIFTRARLTRVLLAVLICGAVALAAEMLYVAPLLRFTGMTYQQVYANPFYRALFSVPYEVLLLAVALGKNWFNHRRGWVRP